MVGKPLLELGRVIARIEIFTSNPFIECCQDLVLCVVWNAGGVVGGARMSCKGVVDEECVPGPARPVYVEILCQVRRRCAEDSLLLLTMENCRWSRIGIKE